MPKLNRSPFQVTVNLKSNADAGTPSRLTEPTPTGPITIMATGPKDAEFQVYRMLPEGVHYDDVTIRIVPFAS